MRALIYSLITILCFSNVPPVLAADLVGNSSQLESSTLSLQQLQGGDPALQWLGSMQAMVTAQTSSTGRQFYVSTGGSNTNIGSQSNPWGSLQHAVSNLQAGDTLYILEGTYTGSTLMTSSGRADAYITIVGVGNVVIDGKSLVSGQLASDPIKSDPNLQGIVAELGSKSAYYVKPAFSTNGHDYIQFKNLQVNRMSAAVDVTPGSSFIVVDGLKTDGNRFAVRINSGTDITVRNAVASNSWNAFRAEGNSSRLLFENVQAYGSKDVWSTMKPEYLNGDGFIFETSVSGVVMRSIVSANHWDGGMDVKASNVLIDHATVYGNKNNFKVWGQNVTIQDSLSYEAKRQLRPDGSKVEGNGLTLEIGAHLTIRRTVFTNNGDYDLRMYENSGLTLQDSIVSRVLTTGGLFRQASGTTFKSERVTWYAKGQTSSSAPMSSTDIWKDPATITPEPAPAPAPEPAPAPAPEPAPAPAPEPAPAPAPAPEPAPAEGVSRTLYVSASGSDRNTGSQTSPWNSLQYAVSQLKAGDTLYIAEGNYSGPMVFNASGRADAYITVIGVGNVVIDGASLVAGAKAADAILGDPDLLGIVAKIGSKSAYYEAPAFSTNGQSYLRLKNLNVKRMEAGVEVTSGSSFIEIDGLKTDGNRYAVLITSATDVTVRNSKAVQSWNAFLAQGNSRRLLFENVEAYGSQDVWSGMNPDYLNGDGFILEASVSDVTLRHIVSGHNWDSGLDIKASNVKVEFAIVYANKNNFKVRGQSVLIQNSLSYGAKAQLRSNGSTVEGNGITVESGGRAVLENVTLADNEDYDIRVYSSGNLTLRNSIVARKTSEGGLFKNDGGSFRSELTIWYQKGRSKPPFSISSSDKWTDPRFQDWSRNNYKLKSSSWGWGRAPGGLNLGAYEYQKTGGKQPGLNR